MPPPSRANNYGPNMHPPPPFSQQGGMQHVGHSLLDRERFQQHAGPQQHHSVHQQHQAQLYAQVQAQQQHQQQAAVRTSQQQQQEKNLLNILSQQRGGAMNGSLSGAVSSGGLGGVVARSIGADPRAQAVAAAQAAAQAAQAAAVVSGEGVIRDVWAENLEAEMGVLRNMVDRYPYIAMDTEFPGIVARPIGKFPSKADYHYQTLRCNVDMLKIIQLGITLANENGDLAKVDGTVSTWQFNFRFNLEEDMYAQDSIELLTKSGIDFVKHTNLGIDVYKFGELLITSGLVMLDEVKWISFHSGYDFGYLVKIMSCTPLPKEEADFRVKLKTFFPSLYDIKYLMKSCRNLKGGLQDIAEEMGIQRIGPQHQAGSDSLLTGMIFFQMRQRFFDGKIDEAQYLGQVWGLNGNNGPAQLTNGTAGSNGASSNSGGVPNPPKTPTMNGSSQQGNLGTPDNTTTTATSTPGRGGTPGTPGYTPGFGKMGM